MSAVVEIPKVEVPVPAALNADGLGCHSGKEQMLVAAKAAGKSEVRKRLSAEGRGRPA
jgi:hypothetical protein